MLIDGSSLHGELKRAQWRIADHDLANRPRLLQAQRPIANGREYAPRPESD